MESIEVLQWYTIAARDYVIIATASCGTSPMNTIIEIIDLEMKCRHIEGFSFSGLDQSWRFPRHQQLIWVVLSAFVAKGFTSIAQLLAMGLTYAMTITGMPERVLTALYFAPTMRPVISSTMSSYHHRFRAFHASNCSLAASESILYLIVILAPGGSH
jgi:hypothetical protein